MEKKPLKILFLVPFLAALVACGQTHNQPNYLLQNANTNAKKFFVEASFTSEDVPLRSGPNIASKAKMVFEALGKKVVLLKQEKSWIQVRFEGETHWVHSSLLDRNLEPPVIGVIFKVSDVLLRSGPGVRYQKVREFADAKYKRAALIENARTWFHSSLVLQHQQSEVNIDTLDQIRSKNSFLEGMKRRAELGDSGAMETIGHIYENSGNLNLEMAYMWMSLALESADAESKKNIRDHLDQHILPEMSGVEIARAERMKERCKRSKFKDCSI